MLSQLTRFNDLHDLLPIKESGIRLSESANIPFSTIDKWIGPDSRTVLIVDPLIAMAKYFECIVDYLLDLSNAG